MSDAQQPVYAITESMGYNSVRYEGPDPVTVIDMRRLDNGKRTLADERQGKKPPPKEPRPGVALLGDETD